MEDIMLTEVFVKLSSDAIALRRLLNQLEEEDVDFGSAVMPVVKRVDIDLQDSLLKLQIREKSLATVVDAADLFFRVYNRVKNESFATETIPVSPEVMDEAKQLMTCGYTSYNSVVNLYDWFEENYVNFSEGNIEKLCKDSRNKNAVNLIRDSLNKYGLEKKLEAYRVFHGICKVFRAFREEAERLIQVIEYVVKQFGNSDGCNNTVLCNSVISDLGKLVGGLEECLDKFS